MRRAILTSGLLVLACASAPAGEPALQGEWKTSLGIVTFKPDGDAMVATFAHPQIPPVKGSIVGKTATLKSENKQRPAEAKLTLDDSGRSFDGTFQFGNNRPNPWKGWRPDPDATRSETGKFDGSWLTTNGLMELEQTGDKVQGRYAVRGTTKIEGTVAGRRLDYRYHWFRPGTGWFDLSKDGKKLEGAAVVDGTPFWYEWQGRRAPEYRRHAPLVAGKIVDGSTEGLLTYSVRAPEGYKEGDPKRWPAIVVLHGSNMNAKAYVNTLAAAWPEIAKEYLILGINGEMASDPGEEPRFNYTYVNYVGRSTYKGFPGTDRESPALVAEALTDLKQAYPIARYFVGGHSQGGFLTYSLLMNTPELIAGAFPISCGVIFQCEPSAYQDEALRKAQRSVPLAIVHGKNDPAVGFGMGQYAAGLFGESNWPAVHFFTSGTAGHMFGLLPVGEAIRWLEAMASDDPEVLLGFAEKQAEASRYHDAIAALRRANTLKRTDPQKARADRLGKSIEVRAKPAADAFLARIQTNADGSWVDGFLAYRDEFEFADAAREVMGAFESLRKQHEPLAQKAFGEARTAFQQGKPDQGYAKLQEIVDKDYAASLYRNIKEQLKSRK
jgi:predicted esterase